MSNSAARPLKSRRPPCYLLSLLIPVYSFLFVLTGPHSASSAFLWVLPMWFTVLVDMWSVQSPARSTAGRQGLSYNCILYILAALQILTIPALLHMATDLKFATPLDWTISVMNLFAIKVIVGTSSSFSGIVVAHELIHRGDAFNRNLGRLLLSLECYEHFATEHLLGHHRNFSRRTDPATARYGESFEAFWRRTVPAQFRNAWRLENRRLNLPHGFSANSSYLKHRVAQGMVFEFGLLVLVFMLYGVVGVVAFAVQAVAAIRKLEAVNYIEHWGLESVSEHPQSQLSWDTDSWFTMSSIVGLSRHSDHHRNACKPYHELEHTPGSPKLPYGYFASVFLTVFFNPHFQKLARHQLRQMELQVAEPEATGR